MHTDDAGMMSENGAESGRLQDLSVRHKSKIHLTPTISDLRSQISPRAEASVQIAL
jgi:hypothetical protein